MSNTLVKQETAALQDMTNRYLGPAWHTGARFVFSTAPVAGDWIVYIRDTTDQAGALGYHAVVNGVPTAYVFARTCHQDGITVSSTVSHEVDEMLVDPYIDRVVAFAGLNDVNPPAFWLVEVGDPVETASFHVDGFQMSDFVTPAFFETSATKGFDEMGLLRAPLTLLNSGCYAWEFIGGAWVALPTQPALDGTRPHSIP